MGSSIQFRGKNTVLEAFGNYQDADAWAIFQAKSLLFKGIGSDHLSQVLDMLEPGGSDAIYQLKVYEDIDNAKNIKEKTDADGSFAFKLGREENVIGGASLHTRLLEERLKKLEEQNDGEDDEDKTIGGKILNGFLGLLEQPNELVQLIGAFKQMFAPQPAQVHQIGRVSTDFAPPVVSQVPAAVSQYSINHKTDPMPEKEKNTDANLPPKPDGVSDEEKILRLSAAINALELADADILIHLERLAEISKDNPAMFKMLITSLDSYNK